MSKTKDSAWIDGLCLFCKSVVVERPSTQKKDYENRCTNPSCPHHVWHDSYDDEQLEYYEHFTTPTTHNNTLLERGKGGTIGGDRGSSRARGRTDRERSASGRSNSRRETHINGKDETKPCPRCGCELSDYRMSGRTYKESGVYCCECEYRKTTERWRRLKDE